MNTQQSKPDPKGKAIASVILGTVSLVLVYNGLMEFYSCISFITVIVAAAGLFLGKTGLKSTKRNSAIIGIILSGIGLLGGIIWSAILILISISPPAW